MKSTIKTNTALCGLQSAFLALAAGNSTSTRLLALIGLCAFSVTSARADTIYDYLFSPNASYTFDTGTFPISGGFSYNVTTDAPVNINVSVLNVGTFTANAGSSRATLWATDESGDLMAFRFAGRPYDGNPGDLSSSTLYYGGNTPGHFSTAATGALSVVPEPTSALLLLGSGAMLLLRRRRAAV